jgi:hypothetical protein
MTMYGERRQPHNGQRSLNDPIHICIGDKKYGTAIINATNDAGIANSLIMIRFSVLSIGNNVSATAT